MGLVLCQNRSEQSASERDSHPATMRCYHGRDKAKHSCSCDVNSNVVSVLSVNLASYTQQSLLT